MIQKTVYGILKTVYGLFTPNPERKTHHETDYSRNAWRSPRPCRYVGFPLRVAVLLTLEINKMSLLNKADAASAMIDFAQDVLGLSESDTAAALIMAAGILAEDNTQNVLTLIKALIDTHNIMAHA